MSPAGRVDRTSKSQTSFAIRRLKQKGTILEMTEWLGHLSLSLSSSISLSLSLPSHFIGEVHDIEHGTELLADKLTLERVLHVILDQENFTYVSAMEEEEEGGVGQTQCLSWCSSFAHQSTAEVLIGLCTLDPVSADNRYHTTLVIASAKSASAKHG